GRERGYSCAGWTTVLSCVVSFCAPLVHTGRAHAGTGGTPVPPPASGPNILVLLADDVGYNDLGIQGSPRFAALTPAIDTLARGGVRFTSGYVSAPLCGPSRAAFMTGRYAQRFGYEDNGHETTGLALTQATVADTLRGLGYRTYCIGKWHLGDHAVYHPNRRGFDEFYGFLEGRRTYFTITENQVVFRLQHNGTLLTEPPDLYTTDAFGQAAIDYLDDHVSNYPEQPFFMYVAFNAVHDPMDPDPGRLSDPRVASIEDPNRRALGAMTLAMDDNIGRILNRLADHGLENDTLVVFFNDNGGPANLSSYPNWSNNAPLRGVKGLLYEGGIRVPFFIRWPGRIPADTVLDDPVSQIDLLPTFVAAANGSLLLGQQVDGVNLLPRLTGQTTTPPHPALFWRTGGSALGKTAVRKDDWKLLRPGFADPSPIELYNLATDLSETTNLADSYPTRVTELSALVDAWKSQLIEPLWGYGGIEVSCPDLTVVHSFLGYELWKSSNGPGYALLRQQAPLPLDRDWSLTFKMQSMLQPGMSRNGFVVLGDGKDPDRLIRCGVSFGLGAIWIDENSRGTNCTAALSTVPSGVSDYRIDYRGADRSLVFTSGSDSVTCTLQGSYASFDYAGYGVDEADTRFSPITVSSPPVVNPHPPWPSRIRSLRSFRPGTYDQDNRFMGGTETTALVAHRGMLYAGTGYRNDTCFGPSPGPDPCPGGQVLVKTGYRDPWNVDTSLGPGYLRVDSLKSIALTTDKAGQALNPPVPVLLAGAGAVSTFPGQATVWVRRDNSGTWVKTIVTTGAGNWPVRALFDHVDRVSGIHHVFAAVGSDSGKLFRGAYNAAWGVIEWQSTPELTSSTRITSGGECNGYAYVCAGGNGVAGDNDGGIFWRTDGPRPQWNFVHEWPLSGNGRPDIRGFTAVADPANLGHEVFLVSLDMNGNICRVEPISGDPHYGHRVITELNVPQFLGSMWSGGTSVVSAIAPANDMPPVTDPLTGEGVHLIGLWAQYPDPFDLSRRNSSWFLVRHHDASYEVGQIVDYVLPVPLNPLRSCRAICPSPFVEDRPATLFFGGFDASAEAPQWHNTAWVYRGFLSSPPDLNGDRAVDQEDVELFAACATGPAVLSPSGGCEDADLDHDRDVDGIDFAILQRCLSQPDPPPLGSGPD
ncbi:MAG: sulfatase-like hydrolase/transferase, partial [Planctomycetes bacterium]|nr:sulfatase-like hydrolase/transferase [Planctomycetota bacterium]